MTDFVSPDPNDEPDIGATFTLTQDGWESVDYVEPGSDWRVLADGGYESPDGRTRTFARADPTGEWSHAVRPSER